MIHKDPACSGIIRHDLRSPLYDLSIVRHAPVWVRHEPVREPPQTEHDEGINLAYIGMRRACSARSAMFWTIRPSACTSRHCLSRLIGLRREFLSVCLIPLSYFRKSWEIDGVLFSAPRFSVGLQIGLSPFHPALSLDGEPSDARLLPHGPAVCYTSTTM